MELIVEVDGRETTTNYRKATHQEAVYVATVKALRQAHALGVTDLTIDSPNVLVGGHIEDGWKRREPRLQPFQDEIESLMKEFDRVQ